MSNEPREVMPRTHSIHPQKKRPAPEENRRRANRALHSSSFRESDPSRHGSVAGSSGRLRDHQEGCGDLGSTKASHAGFHVSLPVALARHEDCGPYLKSAW